MMKNFKIQELVSPELYDMLGDNTWKLFDKGFLEDVDRFASDVKRDLGVSGVIINDWLWGGGYTQSGFREMSSSVGAARSAHKSGKAVDMKFKGCTIKDAYDYLIKYQDRYPNISRVEDIAYTESWLHVDCKASDYLGIYVFKP